MLKDKDFSPLLKFYVSFMQNHSDSKRKHLSHCIGNNWFYTLYVIHWKKKKKRENVSANQMELKIILLSTIEPLRQLFLSWRSLIYSTCICWAWKDALHYTSAPILDTKLRKTIASSRCYWIRWKWRRTKKIEIKSKFQLPILEALLLGPVCQQWKKHTSLKSMIKYFNRQELHMIDYTVNCTNWQLNESWG